MGKISVRMTKEEWSIVAGALWDYTRQKKRTARRREEILVVRSLIVGACREAWSGNEQ